MVILIFIKLHNVFQSSFQHCQHDDVSVLTKRKSGKKEVLIKLQSALQYDVFCRLELHNSTDHHVQVPPLITEKFSLTVVVYCKPIQYMNKNAAKKASGMVNMQKNLH